MDLNKVKENLEKRGYTVSVFETASKATEYIDSKVDGTSIGFGGSTTIAEMKLFEALGKHNDVYWHNRTPANSTANEMREKAAASEIYISSVNGMTESGEIINIDNNCNRVASIMWGHKKVYLVVGANKIEETYDKALYRARNIAGPLNAKRLGLKTPCAVNGGKCYDCQSPDRICRGLVVFWEKPFSTDIEVVLINEKLGY